MVGSIIIIGDQNKQGQELKDALKKETHFSIHLIPKNAIALNAGINTLAGAAGGTVTLNADTAALTIAAAGDIVSDGLVSLSGATGISTAGDVSTTADNVTYNSATTLTGNVLIDTGAGGGTIQFAQTLDGTVADTETLGLTAGTGNVTFSNTVGAGTALGAVTISSAADVGLSGSFQAASLTQTAGSGTTTIDGLLTATTGNVDIKSNAIALNAGMAGGADIILIPEIPYDLEEVAAQIKARERWGARFSIVVVAEGARPVGGDVTLIAKAAGGHVERLGGVGAQVAARLEELTGKDSRTVVLGHLQRGGPPTSYDRVLATRMGALAVELVRERKFGYMVASHPPDVTAVPLEQIVGRMKTVPVDSDAIRAARAIGIGLGD